MTPEQFSDYSSRWNTANDARAFVADKLTPQQFGTMLSSMSPGDQAKFQAAFNRGISQGFIDPPSWMQPQGSASTGASAAPVAQPPPAAATTQSAAAPYVVNAAAQPAIAGGM